MKWLLIAGLQLFLTLAVLQADQIEDIARKYDVKVLEGVIVLNERQIAELELLKKEAMEKQNLPLAQRTASRIEELQTLVNEKKMELQKRLEKVEFPESEHYRMTYSNGKAGSEFGAKILVRFEKKPFTDFAGEKLILKLAGRTTKYAETPHEVFVLNHATGKEVGKIPKLGRGEEAEIPLTLPPSELVDLAILVKGSDAVHLREFSENIPDFYLEIAE